MLHSLKLRMRTRSLPLSGTLTKIKSTENQLRLSFMILTKPLKFSQIETKEATMMNSFFNNTQKKMLTKLSKSFSMSMALWMKRRKSFLILTIPTLSAAIIKPWEFLETLPLAKLKMLTGKNH